MSLVSVGMRREYRYPMARILCDEISLALLLFVLLLLLCYPLQYELMSRPTYLPYISEVSPGRPKPFDSF
jgi:hypothetical protein